MTFLPVANNSDSLSLRSLPTLAIDLGFAEKNESCGLSGFPGSLSFSQAVIETASWLTQQKEEPVLILECPLSGSFNDDGNPMPRGSFETHHSENGELDRRVWQSGAGASMALAAVHFLRRIQQLTAQINSNAHLVEGFCSRYSQKSVCHVSVATELLRLWRQNEHALVETTGIARLSTLRLLDPHASETPPAILRVRDGFPH